LQVAQAPFLVHQVLFLTFLVHQGPFNMSHWLSSWLTVECRLNYMLKFAWLASRLALNQLARYLFT
jgi:hypothetical protein